MESSSQGGPSPDEAASMLTDAEQARAGLAADMRVPSGNDALIGATVALHIATAAVGITVDTGWARLSLLLGVVLFGLVAGVQLHRFRRLNGVWLHGFASRAVFGTATTTSVVYAAAMAASVAAAFQEMWWLVWLCALAGGLGYALSGRRWLRAYRRDPGAHARAESVTLLAAFALLAVVGLVVLLVAP